MNVEKLTPFYLRFGKKAELAPANQVNCLPQADDCCTTDSQKPLGVDFAYASPIINNNYKYKPISRLVPNYELLNCDYNNFDEFSEAYAKKINSQLMDINESDIESLISRIQIRTGASTDLIKEVLYGLTNFSSYDTIDFLQNLADKHSTNCFGMPGNVWGSKSDYSMNAALNYLSRNKAMIESPKVNRKKIIVLDDIFLKQLKDSKENFGELYELFIYHLNHDEIILLNLKGWDVKCLDNKYRSANFLCGSGYLEDMAVDTIKRIQNGEDLDSILYGDFERRLLDITQQDIKVERLSKSTDSEQITTQSILQNVKKPSLTAQDIKSGIISHITNISNSEREYQSNLDHISAFCKYLDLNSVAYSTDSFARALIDLKSKIEKRCGKDFVYIVRNCDKSFSYITGIYAKLHNINPENIATLGYVQSIIAVFPNASKYVILDDITASGNTIKSSFESARKFREQQNSSLYYANVVAAKDSIERFSDDILIYSKPLKDIKEENHGLLNEQDMLFLFEKLGTTYNDSLISCVFPHIIPDNASQLTGEVFKKLLFKNTSPSNKSHSTFSI